MCCFVGDGAWLIEHKAEQRRRFKAVLCAKPRTYSRIREERKKAEEKGVKLSDEHFEDNEENAEEEAVLDGFFLVNSFG